MKYEQMLLTELNELAKFAESGSEIGYSIVWIYNDILLTIGYKFAKQLQTQRRQQHTETTLESLFSIKEGA